MPVLNKEDASALLTEFKALKSLTDRADNAIKKVGEIEKKGVNTIMQGSQSSFPVVGGDSDEKKAMRAFGVNHVAKLLEVNTGEQKFAHVPAQYKSIVLALKEKVDVSRFTAQIWHGAPKDRIGDSNKADAFGHVKNMLDTYYGRHELAPLLKAFGSTVSGAGDEWVPTGIASNYIEEYQIDPVLEQRFQKTPMPTNPYDLPTQSGIGKATIIAENTSMAATNFSTDKLRFTAHKFGKYYELPEELSEDSAPDVIAAARYALVDAQLKAIESALLNGDDDGTHIDSDTQSGAADLAEKAWKGLRRQAIANSSNGGTNDCSAAAITVAMLRKIRANMKKFGSNPAELMWIVGPVVYTQLLALDQVSTIDKFGPQATVLRGALAAYQGIPILNSEHMREDLNASGVYDGSVTTRAGILLVNMKRWWVGTRRPIIMKVMPDLPGNDRLLMASYQRKDFEGMPQSATEVSVSYGINILI